MSGQNSKNFRTQVKIEKYGFICPDSGHKLVDFICPLCECAFRRTHLRTNVRSRQDKDFNYVWTQVRIVKDGFDLCPDICQNVKIGIIYVQSWTPQRTKYGICISGHKSKSQKMDLNYVRTQVKIVKDGFDLCLDASQNRKI